VTGEPAAGRTVFTFWEPAGEMSAYLRLCLRTWEQALPGYPIVVLDRAGLDRYIDPDVYDLPTLEQVPLPMQKDAIMVAVLERHGGVFMDVDTLAFRDLAPLIEGLDRSDTVMLGMHMAFLAARPGAPVLSIWRAGIQEKLHRLAGEGPPPGGLKWDHLGNRELRSALETLAGERPGRQPVGAGALGAAARITGGLQHRRWAPRMDRGLDRLENGLAKRRLRLLFRGPLRDRLALLDARRTGYIAETAHFRSRRLSTRRKYERFWFEEDLDVGTVTALDPVIVGLHNSWTPPWFSALSESEVLGGRCLLSRTLRHLLSG
jgi:hypothetical protein